ncbi:K(+)-transporting ATPase subunit B [Collinsella sp. TF10-11AT]|uniref:potassium-transporting ATPase subunit KdpB n=1 Tax=Collinsella TaxID=102106 RepID=UPI000E418379|nr:MULTISPECIES: potassium-transporting ATPase subunit KdpB [Collinsella]RGX81833.1 K(+)-transporting ATPase subunit B [Collinsella sp. OF03-4AA]RGJ53567.1 K(+)-transporting ATPase subunit B [Collinsella sp. TM06-3]RGK64737.1 K(+)-transporting ATPase subunit B [Collinsella sp. TF10-11AT]RGM28948.1 K(+)-transporting ATPase subunit B [Collinsella sp. OM08-14AT]RGN70504.1 K(+)-transporting ATPase subunit B [Collinsella sp. OM04-5]
MTMQKDMMGRAVRDSFAKLDPRVQIQNPVMFLVWLSAVMTSVLVVASIFGVRDAGVPTYYVVAIAVILWLTDLFSNFAEALAEGRGKAQADSLRAAKKDVEAHRIESVEDKEHFTVVPGTELTRGDLVIVRAGEQIPGDGDVIEGAASVDESAITGESAPVVREAGGDRSAVTGGTTVLSDWIIVKISSEPGQSFLDKMIAMVEGAARKKTPNEIALEIFLVALSIVFILVTLALYCYSCFSVGLNDMVNPTAVTTLVALLVCLAPTTIGALLSAIGIAGMSRLNEANVLAMSGRAIEAAGDVDILMLDKTGTITLGNRQAAEFIPVDGVDPAELADAAQLSSLADETPEGRSIVVLAKEQFGLRGRTLEDKGMEFIPFTAATRMSGVNYEGNEIRKGAADSVRTYLEAAGGVFSQECEEAVERIAKAGGTPLVVTKNCRVLGVVYLKDIIKSGVKEKFADLRKMGIKTIMVTGDNPLTAAAIAAEAGVDDFLAEATPEGKLEKIREFQREGHLVAMTGDGTNDAPALAQADVAVAMNTGTQAAKEAGNMVDLDSSPTKLIEVVRIGKQLLMTRGSLTTFSVANDVAKYFAIIPALFSPIYSGLGALNILSLTNPLTAVLSAIIYNALVIVALIPAALKGVKYREVPSGQLLTHNLLVWGLGGIVAPFVFIKIIDMLLALFGIGMM